MRAVSGRESVWQFFVDRCVQNLHVVLCMSPTGQQLQIRCRNFPGLVNNTTIDWFQPWPEQALYAVASVFLAEVRWRDGQGRRLSGRFWGVGLMLEKLSCITLICLLSECVPAC